MSWFGRPAASPDLGRLVPAQAEACEQLHAACFPRGWSALEFERLLAAPACFGEAATDRRTGAMLGFVLSRGAAGEAEILSLAVDPAGRRRGLGRRLMETHLRRLAAAGIGTLILEVEESNAPARALYRATGFVEVGRREAYYRATDGSRAAALILRRATG